MVFVFGILSISSASSARFRSAFLALITPASEAINPLDKNPYQREMQQIKSENLLLKIQLEQNNHVPIQKHDEGVLAKVIYRSPTFWSSVCWINLGSESNHAQVIARNSPVLSGQCLVGLIDYVGKHQSRVRLITDSSLVVAVRAVRGDLQRQYLKNQINDLQELIGRYAYFFETSTAKSTIDNLQELSQAMPDGQGTWFLAKGELQGSSQPLWRSLGCTLKGTGFNYDFSDEYGPSRDLRTGAVFQNGQKKSAVPILKVNDLLVTTGLDGVFPPGLNVAEVAKIKPLKEGDYYYDLEAIPTAGNLHDLNWLYVIPPVSFDLSDKPPT